MFNSRLNDLCVDPSHVKWSESPSFAAVRFGCVKVCYGFITDCVDVGYPVQFRV